MKSYDTRFCILVDGTEFYSEGGSICVFPLLKAKQKIKELKAEGHEVSAMPYVERAESSYKDHMYEWHWK